MQSRVDVRSSAYFKSHFLSSTAPSTSSVIIPISHHRGVLFLFIVFLLFFVQSIESTTAGSRDWTNSGYPDLRGPTFQVCQLNVTNGEVLYICDPDNILNGTERLRINTELEKLATATPCPCQRRSQCSAGGGKGNPFHGFVVSIALVRNLQMSFHSPSEQQLTDRAASFCKTLEGRWALGDCGNSVLIFVWQHYKKMIIWPARLAERYVTTDERKHILSRVNDLVQTDRWAEALSQVIDEIHLELKGEPEDRVDTGTLSLIIAVGVASLLTILITCCVCAFRCCGNLTPDEDTKSLSQNDSSFASMNQKFSRNIEHFRRSTSRSPKFPVRSAMGPLNYTVESEITVV
ncbi:hypothetical protein M3Y94_00376700 [Aphelenchoides besseyi]|nr:hypothetical protein M3Y94_00376700 [Aphelenchoides besseyi]KAI6235125.1 hypothetical protein M3Y95_00018000 [Aphelenchoides besseyi]